MYCDQIAKEINKWVWVKQLYINQTRHVVYGSVLRTDSRGNNKLVWVKQLYYMPISADTVFKLQNTSMYRVDERLTRRAAAV